MDSWYGFLIFVGYGVFAYWFGFHIGGACSSLTPAAPGGRDLVQCLRAEVARLTREADWAHRGWDDAREHADQHERESDALRTLVTQLVGALRDALTACEIMFRGAPGLSPEMRAAAEYSMRPARAALAAAEQAGIR